MQRRHSSETLQERTSLDRTQSVHTQRTAGGLKVLCKHYPAAPVVTIWVWIGVGSVNEPAETAGISHVLEHMAFKGTRRRGPGEISREVESRGGVINAFTGYYATAFYVSLPREELSLGVDILADVLCNSVFDEVELRRELQVIREEIRLRDDRPASRLWELITGTVFRRHLLGRPIAGSHAGVDGLSRQQVFEHFQRYYTPANTRVAVVGDVDPAVAYRVVAEGFADYARQGRKPPRPPREPNQREFRLRVEEMPVARARLALAWPTVSQLHADAPALDILADILGNGRSSRLYSRLKERRGLVDDVQATSYTGDDAGLFVVEAELDPDGVDEVTALVNGEVELLRNLPVGPYELGRVRNAVELEYLENHETAEGQAQEICYYDQLGGWRLADAYLDNLYRVDAKRLREVAICYLSPSSLNAALLVPEGRGADFAGLTPAAARLKMPPRKRPLPEKPPQIVIPAKVAVEEVELDNGVRLIIRRNANIAQTSMLALVVGGFPEEEPAEYGITNLALDLALRGTRRRGAEAFHSQLEFYGTAIDDVLRRDCFGLRLDCASRHLEPCLELFGEALCRPAFPEARLENTRGDVLAEIATRPEEAVGYALGKANIALYGGRGYGHFLAGETDTVTALDRDRLEAWYRRRLSGKRLVFSIGGGLDGERTRRLVGGLLEELPAGSAPPPPPECRYQAVTLEERLPKQQTHIALAHPAPGLADEDRFAAAVLAQVLSGTGNRLFVRLRDELHLAYLVFFNYRPQRGGGAFFSYLGTQPGRGDEALAALEEELAAAAAAGLSVGEIEEAKTHLGGLYKLSRQRNAGVVATYGQAAACDRSPSEVDAFPERIRAVEAAAVNAVLRRYLAERRPSRFLLRGTLPERRVGEAEDLS